MFGIKKLKYEFSSRNGLSLHARIPTITFRGAFGYALAQVISRSSGIESLDEQVETYRQFFMPAGGGEDVQRRALARPFVLRGYYSRPDRRSFVLELLLFGAGGKFETFFDTVVEVMDRMGIGQDRRVCRLEKLGCVDVNLSDPEPTSDLVVEFLTPCVRLRHLGRMYKEERPFHVLLSRLVDRVVELDRLYGDGVEAEEGKIVELKRRSREVASVKLSGGVYDAVRTSGRTGDRMYLDGFVGEMQYTGEFTCFRDVLRYLPWVNLGHFNVFGCGWCNMHYL